MTNRLIDPQLLERPLAFEWPRLRTKLRVVLLACISAFVLVIPAPAAADDTPCVALLAGVTRDNIVVPPNASCTLTNVTVLGNVKVLENANLITNGTTKIHGSAYGEGANTFGLDPSTEVRGNVHVTGFVGPVSLCGTTIGGDVQLKEGTVSSRYFVGVLGLGCPGNTIHGTVALYDNASSSSTVVGNVIQSNANQGNLQAYKNTGGQLQIINNMIRGNLQCFDNDPPPTGAGNTAQQKEGQCRTF